MPSIAHLGDSLSHGGRITSASGNVFADGIAVARVGDSALCDEHGEVTITSGSSTVFVNGQSCAYDGSVCSCGAVVQSGSSVTVGS